MGADARSDASSPLIDAGGGGEKERQREREREREGMAGLKLKR